MPVATTDPYHASDDSEEDDEEGEPEDEGGEQVKKEGEVKSEVKAEPGTSGRKSKDASELRVYHEDELMLFKPDQLHADVQLLDGTCIATRYAVC